MKTTRLLPALVVLALFFLPQTKSAAQSCGPFDVDVVINETLFGSLVIYTAVATVELQAGATAPFIVDIDLEIYDGGTLVQTGGIQTLWPFGATSTSTSISYFKTLGCGYYEAKATAVGFDASASVCTPSPAASGDDDLCRTQYEVGGVTVACNPDICPTISLRTPAPSVLEVTELVQDSYGTLSFEVNAPSSQSASVELMTLEGKTVLRQAIELRKGSQSHKLPFQELPTGLYLLRVNAGQEQITKKVMLK